MDNLKSILSSFKLKNELNPKIWDKSKNEYILNPKVRTNLLEIAYDFIESLNVDVVISDIIMTGSLSNFNWSNYSDVDLHVVADFDQFSKSSRKLYEELFKLKKTVYGVKHNLKIFGYDVELYIEDETILRDVKSAGRYSVLHNEWVVKPPKESVNIKEFGIKEKAKKWMKIIDDVEEIVDDKDIETAKKLIKNYTEKIRKFRECGLEKGGEYSEENLVFKILRRNGYLDKLREMKDKVIDKKLSIKEATLGAPLDIDLKVNSDFGVQRGSRKHPGVDLFANSGTEVKSPADGKVIDAGMRDNGCGGTIHIEHSNGFKTRYCHIKKINVNQGDIIKRGDLIGLTGGAKNDPGAGHSTGAHLHFEVYKDGNLVDPMDYIGELGRLGSNSSLSTTNQDKKSKSFMDSLMSLLGLGNKIKDNDFEKISDSIKDSKFLKSIIDIVNSGKTLKNLKNPKSKIPYDKDVEIVQTALQFLGFSLPKWGVDGLFGNETQSAVESFEKENDLNVDGELDSNDLKILVTNLSDKGFTDEKLSNIQKDSDFSKISIGSDKDFYSAILEGVGAPVTDENLKFLYAWRRAEGGKAENNPFNTTYKLSKDLNMSNYNKVGVKNYSTPNYGIEATVNTLKSRHYTCIVDGLKNNIGAEKISRCESLKTWGTGDLVSTVLRGGNVEPPKIYNV
jgi:peptidoglycan hydrolase-like protein with peptidoglycan-binding domain